MLTYTLVMRLIHPSIHQLSLLVHRHQPMVVGLVVVQGICLLGKPNQNAGLGLNQESLYRRWLGRVILVDYRGISLTLTYIA